MQCPVCKVELKIADRQGVEIDYCPKCRGVWLDRGELDKLIERESEMEGRAVSTFSRSERQDDYYLDDEVDYRHSSGDRYRDDRDHPHGKKKKSFLGDVFDIFG